MSLARELAKYSAAIFSKINFSTDDQFHQVYDDFRRLATEDKKTLSTTLIELTTTEYDVEPFDEWLTTRPYVFDTIDYPAVVKILETQNNLQHNLVGDSVYTIQWLFGDLQILRNPKNSRLGCQCCDRNSHPTRLCTYYPYRELRVWKMEQSEKCSNCTVSVRNVTDHQCQLNKGCAECPEFHVSSINHHHRDIW